MSISAINCTPIKPQVSSFKGESEFDYDKLRTVTDKVNDQFIKKGDVKNPLSIMLSVAIALAASYGAGKAAGLGAGKLFPKLGVALENGLKTASTAIKNQAVKMQSNVVSGKIGNIEKLAGSLLEKANTVAKDTYKKVAYAKISPATVNPERATQAMANVVGLAFGAKTAVDLATKDENGDGVKDIMQKSQNFYTGSQTTYGNVMKKMDTISSIVNLIS